MKKGTRTIRLVLALVAFAALCSCADTRGSVMRLEVERGLEATLRQLLDTYPLPEPFRIAGEAGEPYGIVLRLESLPGSGIASSTALSTEPGRRSVAIGLRWLASPLSLWDPRQSLSPAESEGKGLVDLCDILPPLRASRVSGLWPGEEGYPYEETIVLKLESATRFLGRPARLPGSILAWQEQTAISALKEVERPIKLGAVGDIEVGPAQSSTFLDGEEGLASLFRGGLLELMRSRDILVGNLEGPISARGESNPRKRYLFRFPPGSAKALASAGFDLLLLANNHVFDFGAAAFEDCLNELNETGLPFVGAGMDSASASEGRRLEREGAARAFHFVGYASFPDEGMGFTLLEAAAGAASAGVNASVERTVGEIGIAAARGDTVILLAHGGYEYRPSPPGASVATFRRFAEAGAALVIGSHPHVLQGVEAWEGSLIAYSLGNFLFTGEREPPEARDSALLTFLMYKGRVRGLAADGVEVGLEYSLLDDDTNRAGERLAALSADLASANKAAILPP